MNRARGDNGGMLVYSGGRIKLSTTDLPFRGGSPGHFTTRWRTLGECVDSEGILGGDMARPLRIEYPGAVYHLTSRGNERKAIFRADADREAFLAFLAKVVDGETQTEDETKNPRCGPIDSLTNGCFSS